MRFFPGHFCKHFALIGTYRIRCGRRVSSVLDLLTFQLDARCCRFFVRRACKKTHQEDWCARAVFCTASAPCEFDIVHRDTRIPLLRHRHSHYHIVPSYVRI